MVSVQNKKVIERISDDAKIQQLEVSPVLKGDIQPVLISNPHYHIEFVEGGSQVSTGTLGGYTAHASKETYLTGINTGIIKDSNCDIATGVIYVQTSVGGKTVTIKRIPVITLTAQEYNESVLFNPPLKIDKSATVTMTGTFTAGVLVRSLGVFGYTLEEM